MRGDDVLAAADVAESRAARRRGLLGRECIDGALVLRPCRSVHTLGMKVPVDVAFCAADGTVLRVLTLRPWRVTPFVARAAFVVEAGAGCFERWRLGVGDVVEVRS